MIVEDLNGGAKVFGKYCDPDFLLPISEDLRKASMKNLYWNVSYVPEDKRFRSRRFTAGTNPNSIVKAGLISKIVVPSIKLREGIYDFGETCFLRDERLLQRSERSDFKSKPISSTHLFSCVCIFSVLYGLVAYFHLKRVLSRRYKSVKRLEVHVRKRGRE